jgi:hypothetical protein
MIQMSRLRFLLILFLAVALDVSGPVKTEALDPTEEIEETLHRGRGGRVFRLIRESATAATVHRVAIAPVSPIPIVRSHRPRPVSTDVRVRKAPPPVSAASSAPEDH